MANEEISLGVGTHFGGVENRRSLSVIALTAILSASRARKKKEANGAKFRGSIQLDIENSIDFSIEFCSTVGHPVKLNRKVKRIFNRVFNIQLN